MTATCSVAAGAMLLWSFMTTMTPHAALRFGDPVERVQAVEYFIKQGPEGVPELVYALKNYPRETRILSLFGLQRMGLLASDALESVREAMADRDPQVRSAAIGAYWQIRQDPREAASTLIPLLDDPNRNVCDVVQRTLQAVGLSDTESIMESLNNDCEEFRSRLWPVVEAIWNTGRKPEIGGAVRQLLSHANPQIHNEALLKIVQWDQASLLEIRELFALGDVQLASSPQDPLGSAALDIALQAISRPCSDIAEFGPDILQLIKQQEQLEQRSPSGNDDFLLHGRFQRLLAILIKMPSSAKTAVPLLLDRLNELHAANRIRVSGILVEMGCDPETIVSILIPYLDAEPGKQAEGKSSGTAKPHELARQAAFVLAHASPVDGSQQVSLLVTKLGNLETGINRVPLNALVGLGRVAQESLADVLIPLIQHPDREIRLDAVEALAQMGPKGKSAVPALIVRLENGTFEHDPELTRSLIRAFGQIGPAANDAAISLLSVIEFPDLFLTAALPTLYPDEIFSSSTTMLWSDMFKLTAISSLGKIGNPSPPVVSVLCRELQAPLPDRRLAACKALRSISEVSDGLMTELLRLLTDETDTVRVQAALTIGNLKGNRKCAVSAIRKLLADQNGYVRQAAIIALGNLGADARSALQDLRTGDHGRGQMDPAWYARMTGAPRLPSWFDETPDFPQTTMDQAIRDAIAAIDPDGSPVLDSETISSE